MLVFPRVLDLGTSISKMLTAQGHPPAEENPIIIALFKNSFLHERHCAGSVNNYIRNVVDIAGK